MEATQTSAKPSFSQMLRLRLIEDACLRAHARQVHAALEAARAAASQAKKDAGLFPRLLGSVLRRKGGRRTPAETAKIFSREKEAQQLQRTMEHVLQRYTQDLNTLIMMHLQERMPVFLEYSGARKRLGEWEKAVNALQTDLRGLLKALGSARNSATSGYNKSKRAISGTAQIQFTKADELVRSVEARVKLVNEKAQELGKLPEVAAISCQQAVKSLPGLELGAMQKEFDRLTKELEAYEKTQLADLKEPVVQAALQREAEAGAYLEQYREELRQFSDRQMTPEEMARAVPEILARQGR